MLHRVEIDHTYGPEALAVVGAAFDRVWQAALQRMKPMNVNDDAKRALALTVLRLFDHGERDPERLAEIALHECSGTDGSTIGNRWATGRPPTRQRSKPNGMPVMTAALAVTADDRLARICATVVCPSQGRRRCR